MSLTPYAESDYALICGLGTGGALSGSSRFEIECNDKCHERSLSSVFCVIFFPQHHDDGSRGQLKGLGVGRDAAWVDRQALAGDRAPELLSL